MERIEHSVIVAAPISSVFAQWTAGKAFAAPQEGLQSIRIAGDKVEWRAGFGGDEFVRESEIIEVKPESRIAWQGDGNSGHVEFAAVGNDETRVTLMLECDLPDTREEEAGIGALLAAAAAELGAGSLPGK